MSVLVRRGLAFPTARMSRQARRVCVWCELLEGAGEEEFTRWVKGRAHHYGWQGVHLRYSQGVMESVHTKWHDGYSEAYGMPDWRFWSEQRHQSFDVELKGCTGRLRAEQKLALPSLRRGGITVFEWWPKHHHEAERVFREGLSGV